MTMYSVNLKDAEFLDAEAKSLLDKANDTAADYDKSDIVTQFRRAAEKFPDNIAVVFGEKRYTYMETDESTERIAAYLSGSTGVPKGVMLENWNLTCFVAWDKRTNHITEKSQLLEYASYGFDAHMIAVYPALTAGAAVHIVSEDMRLDFEALQKYFDDEKITNSCITTFPLRKRALFCSMVTALQKQQC